MARVLELVPVEPAPAFDALAERVGVDVCEPDHEGRRRDDPDLAAAARGAASAPAAREAIASTVPYTVAAMPRLPPPNHRATERRTFDAPEYADASLTSWQPAAISSSSARRRTARRGTSSARSPAPCRRARSPRRSSCSSTRPSSRSAGAPTRMRSCTSPENTEVEIVETDRGGKSTFHGPGQLVCYPILDLKRHGSDIKQYVRDLEEALIRTLAPLGIEGTRLDGLAGVWLDAAAPEDRLDRRACLTLGDDARLRAQRRPRSGAVHRLDHGVRPRGRDVHDGRARARPAGDGRRGTAPRDRRPLEEVFGLELEELPADDGAGLWPQPRHAQMATR